MRYGADHKAKTRTRILRSAARLFRARGIAATGVDGVMAAAGLTAGGFYAHFRSKDALVADAVDAAGEESYESWFTRFEHLRGRAWARELFATYLSPEHRDNLEKSCILPSLAGDMARAKRPSRERFERRLRRLFEHVAERLDGELPVSREEIIAAIALSAGGVLLARAVPERALSNEILSASRKGAERLLGLDRGLTKRTNTNEGLKQKR